MKKLPSFLLLVAIAALFCHTTFAQARHKKATQTDNSDSLPLNALVQELRNQAIQGVTFFPPFPPTNLARTDITAKVKGWQNNKSGDGSVQRSLRRADVFTLEGTSVFLLQREADTFSASSGIPATDGKVTTRGAVWAMNNQDPSTGKRVSYPVLSGVVWTPRVSIIEKLVLSGTDRITTSPDFDFDAFKNSPAVISFANGYAVNLFGQKLDEGGFLDLNAEAKSNYVSQDGKPLFGRVIRLNAGKLEEIIVNIASNEPAVASVTAPPARISNIYDAAKQGDLEALNKLLKGNPELVLSKDLDGWTALHYASINGHRDVSALLLANKADVNAKDNDGNTPLHVAANKDMAELLLTNRADINAKNKRDWTPLFLARTEGRKDVVEYLLQRGGLK